MGPARLTGRSSVSILALVDTAAPLRVSAPEAISALFQGVEMGLSEPSLRRKLVVSLLVNLVAFSLLLWGLLSGAFGLVDWMLPDAAADADGFWSSVWAWTTDILGWVLKAAAVLGSLFLAPVLFNVVASVLLPAFHGPVYAEARRLAGGPEISRRGPGLATTVSIELRRLVRLIVFSLLLLPLNFVPVIGSAAYLVGQFTLSARTLGWDLLSYHFELHGLTYQEQQAFVRQHRSLVFALGGVATLLCTVPVIQIFFLTTNVAGAGIVSARMDGAPKRPPG